MGYDDAEINLKNFLKQMDLPRRDTWKCRITYDKIITHCELKIYKIKPVKSLKVVSVDDLDYKHKWADRSELESLYEQRGDCDDIIISQDGFIKDSFYANLLFYKNGIWYTPKSPLLKGVQRAALLKEGKIVEKNIKLEKIRKYKKIKLINAMIGMNDAKSISTRRVYY